MRLNSAKFMAPDCVTCSTELPQRQVEKSVTKGVLFSITNVQQAQKGEQFPALAERTKAALSGRCFRTASHAATSERVRISITGFVEFISYDLWWACQKVTFYVISFG